SRETETVVPSDPQSFIDDRSDPIADIPADSKPAPAVQTSGGTEANHPAAPVRWREWVIPVAQWTWIAGTVLCAAVAGARVIRFSRALRYAIRAREVQPRANLLARRLGLRGAPPVWFVPGCVSPMLWSLLGCPRLLLPRELWARLNLIERDTILLHELAHWRRGDPVIRWIELVATCLYWWHPACWWARRELREAEEQCCDAWVLWALPGTFKNYANALLEAVEFVSVGADRPSARSAVPALASRMGQFVHLRRRLTMLKHGNIARALSWGGLAGVMTLGSFVLPVAPTWGQDRPEPQPQPQPEPREVAPDVQVQSDPFAAPAGEPGEQKFQTTPAETAPDQARENADLKRRLADLDRARADLDRQMAALKRARAEADRAQRNTESPTLPRIEGMVNPPDAAQTRAEMAQAKAEAESEIKIQQLQLAHAEQDLQQAQRTIEKLNRALQGAQARIAELERRSAGGGFGGGGGFYAPGGAPRTTPPVPAPAPRSVPAPMAPVAPMPPAGDARDGGFEYRVAPKSAGPRNVSPDEPSAKPGTMELDRNDLGARLEVAPGPEKGQYRVIIKDPTTGRIKEMQTRQLDRPGAKPGADQAKRLDKIEAELDMLTQEIQKMRSSGAPSPAPERPE
ncbi:MAG TPA: M56 family metallopeptidase, partial [Tepidisphaeraceae bacterium]